MTPVQLTRAAKQQRATIAAFERDLAASAARHTDLSYLRAAATARATRVGPEPDRPAVHGVHP